MCGLVFRVQVGLIVFIIVLILLFVGICLYLGGLLDVVWFGWLLVLCLWFTVVFLFLFV